MDDSTQKSLPEEALLGGGCFWGIEATFRNVTGVIDAAVGYSGGHTLNPTYEAVCNGHTGHAEVVWVQYDPRIVTYEDLLTVFFANHNPTTLNRQGPDVGKQYRSVIFYYTPQQADAATDFIYRLQQTPVYKHRPIVTQVQPAGPFYKAEDYHQQYLQKRGLQRCSL
jgi:peptide-methionine (S)-S-oxide reductase